jgi:uncharacterized HAD superfamily protein
MTLNFCIDIDNVIGQTDLIMRKVIRNHTQGRVVLAYEDILEFNYHECKDSSGNSISAAEWHLVHELFSEPEHLRSVAAMPGAVKALHEIAELGQIHIATTRLPKARRSTVEWLESLKLPPHSLHFLNHGQKHSALRHFDFAIEDDYVQALAFAGISGTQGLLMRHPWNATKPLASNLSWVHDWSGIVDFIKAQAQD